MWYCTSEQLATIPGWLSKADATLEPFVHCERVTPEVAAENGLDIARAFRVVIRIAESFPF